MKLLEQMGKYLLKLFGSVYCCMNISYGLKILRQLNLTVYSLDEKFMNFDFMVLPLTIKL